MKITGQSVEKISAFLMKYRDLQIEFRDLKTGDNIQMHCGLQQFQTQLSTVGHSVDMDFVEVDRNWNTKKSMIYDDCLKLRDFEHIGNLGYTTGPLIDIALPDPSEACPGCGYSNAICKC